MNIGLFLDVDNTLTVGFIQQHFASLLGVEAEYLEIEGAFQQNAITSSEFGKRLIALFNGAGFSADFAALHYPDIEQAPWVDDLLQLPATKYLVSSGPSYFVRHFAKEHGIPDNNILCSEYTFRADGRLEQCKAVTGPHKQDFVAQRSALHSLTIGLGDSPLHDGPFVTACDIPILTESAPGTLTLDSLDTVRTLICKLSRRGFPAPRTRPALFIGSSSEALPIAKALHRQLEEQCDPTIWKDGVFQPSWGFLESLENSLSRFDFAAIILSPDDMTITRGKEEASVRDNVLFELGLFMGRLGRERCFMLQPRGVPLKLPSDFSGVVLLEYPGERVKIEPIPALISCADSILSCIASLGCREGRL